MRTANVEPGVLEAFRQGLNRAISDTESADESDLDSIKKHKLILMGIRHFGLEEHVTIQWYLDGDMLPKLEESQTGVIQTNAGVESGPFPDLDEISHYYQEELDESTEANQSLDNILSQETFQWLKSYYEERDIPFKNVYLANMKIHLHIMHCVWFCDSEHSRSELPDDLTTTVSDAAMDMKRELVQYPLFRNLPPFVTEFARIATRVFNWFEKQDLDDTSGYARLFRELDRFYYWAVWKPIANRIGYYTVDGSTDEETREEREDHLEDLKTVRQNFLRRLNDLREELIEHDILIDPRVERLPNLKPEERNFEEILEWEPPDRNSRANANSD